jgi:hypothetical protein
MNEQVVMDLEECEDCPRCGCCCCCVGKPSGTSRIEGDDVSRGV